MALALATSPAYSCARTRKNGLNPLKATAIRKMDDLELLVGLLGVGPEFEAAKAALHEQHWESSKVPCLPPAILWSGRNIA